MSWTQEDWARLEYAVSRVLAASTDPSRRRWWCDGFIPAGETDGAIVGQVWMVYGQEQQCWEFELRPGTAHGTPKDVDGARLDLDFNGRRLRIDLSTEHSD